MSLLRGKVENLVVYEIEVALHQLPTKINELKLKQKQVNVGM